jgi:hypothetical protein
MKRPGPFAARDLDPRQEYAWVDVCVWLPLAEEPTAEARVHDLSYICVWCWLLAEEPTALAFSAISMALTGVFTTLLLAMPSVIQALTKIITLTAAP